MILVGTAGYSYKDWKGTFYPNDIKPSDMLEYYTKNFNFVEINSSFYHMPSIKLFKGLDKKTPKDFILAVKVFRGFTHERTSGEKEAKQFMYAVQPIHENSKLVCLLAQFPYSFHYNEVNMEYLKRLREWFKSYEISIEFRNRSWIRSNVIAFLRKENLGFVCVDEPRIRGLINNVIVSTSNTAYVRMHGRNIEKWYGTEGSERYNYLYKANELLDWVKKIKELETHSDTTIVSFNNHPLGKAVENARLLRKMVY